MKTEAWKIGIVEDEESWRRRYQHSLQDCPEIQKLFFWNSAETFLHDNKREDLDLLYVDVMLPHMNGIDLIAMLRETEPELRIAIISTMNSDEIIFRALRLGAVGYVYKDELFNLSRITQQIMAGGASISPTIALKVLRSFQVQPVSEEAAMLSDREKQVLELLARGMSTKKVAAILGITENTIRNHTYTIYQKLNVHNRIELTRKAAALGMV